MTETEQSGVSAVDWADVERRGRRRQWLLLPLMPVVFGAMYLLTGRFWVWEGGTARVALAVFVVLGVALLAVSAATPRLRARTPQGLRIQYAIRRRVDPGPELRQRTDVYARSMAVNGWFAWFFPLILASFVPLGRWDRPLIAVPSALVLVAAVAAYVLWWHRQTTAARRWVADPPGPARDVPPPRWAERWLTGRRLVWLLLGFVAVNLVVVTVLALVLR